MIPAVLLFPLIASGVIGAEGRGYKMEEHTSELQERIRS